MALLHGTLPTASIAHEHAWVSASRHAVSHGTLVYVRCAGCGAHRVDFLESASLPPAPLTRPVGGALAEPR